MALRGEYASLAKTHNLKINTSSPKFVYFQSFDEFFRQIQFFPSNQMFVYFQRFDEFLPQFQSFLSDQKFLNQRFDEFLPQFL